MATRIIALVNQKGGTGKTTSTISIGAGLSRRDRRVLLIDMDPQASLSYSLGIEPQEGEPTIYGVLMGKTTAAGAIYRKGYGTEGRAYDVIPASLGLAAADLQLEGAEGRETRLRDALEPLKGRYDYILIDAAPGLNLLTLNVLSAAKELFIPLQAESLSLKGISLLSDTVELIRARINPDLAVTGVIAVRYSGRKIHSRDVMDAVRGPYGGAIFKTAIRDNVSIAEAPSYGADIFEYSPRSNGARDYAALVDEVIDQERGRL